LRSNITTPDKAALYDGAYTEPCEGLTPDGVVVYTL
jgi:hypothetical protein